jgi:hypothetical protein
MKKRSAGGGEINLLELKFTDRANEILKNAQTDPKISYSITGV